ncbi:T-complex protein 11-domain-containing protein [Gymnopilus junonius]|uniref:T-complex protein 11-domain-containing protein n=1 Tax=Gymnopilus junonius TaxID=109634 RepID=A0A9P5NYH2_GYMJU|nr:T-complex protein 11-domain-containing protein [Gymnopilus junonius]
MDDLAHRKRKQDQDDRQESKNNAPVAVPDRRPSDPPNPPGPSSIAPRLPRLAETADSLWTSPTSPQVSSPLSTAPVLINSSSSKRPRIDTQDATLRKRPTRRLPVKIFSSSPLRIGSDIEDIGIVPTSDPGPSSGSLLRERCLPAPEPRWLDLSANLNSPHIPSMKPPINRSTLKELELDIILRNPVIRHDLLFDPGLQFRPHRKRQTTEKYWNAVWEELQTGCTCVTLDAEGNLHSKSCMCSCCPEPLPDPVVQNVAISGAYTIRMPSRIPALLTEFIEVMVFVIQPLNNTNIYADPNSIKDQAQEHSAHAASCVFDPSGLFFHIGETLKHHCAPMRDRAVEEMVQVAQQRGPEAFKAVRMCMELLELMKLDIANHQLIQLRPWLLRNTSDFEIKAFNLRFGANASLHNTREWLHTAHDSLLARKQPIFHPSWPDGALRYSDLTRNQQIYLSSLKGIVDIIFDSSNLLSTPPANNSPPPSPLSPATATPPSSPLITVPETLHLDKSRLSHISSDAVDATALYMFILLFRQLVFSDLSASSVLGVKVDQKDILRLKREIRDIGPTSLGTCFLPPESDQAGHEYKDWEDRRNVQQDLVLQIAKRAFDVRNRKSSPTCSSEGISSAPDQALLSVAERWANVNMQPGSTLSVFLLIRLRDAVFDAVVCLAYPGREAAARAGKSLCVDLSLPGGTLSDAQVRPTQAAGMESLTDEIRRLAEKIARLALIHLYTHLPLYESEGFFSNRVA